MEEIILQDIDAETVYNNLSSISWYIITAHMRLSILDLGTLKEKVLASCNWQKRTRITWEEIPLIHFWKVCAHEKVAVSV